MSSLLPFMPDLPTLVQWAGYAGLTGIIFAETGLLAGFFLPGDSLLVTAGLLSATTGLLNVYYMGALLTLAAILGDTVGYGIGKATGPRLFRRDDSRFFKRKHLLAAHRFYEQHGGKAVILARFVPIARTFVPTVAGMAQMGYRRYMMYNIVGAFMWVWSMLFIGYFLGRFIPGVDKYAELIILVVIALSLIPGVVSWLRERKRSAGESAGAEALPNPLDR
jgi:membrane-associated protein